MTHLHNESERREGDTFASESDTIMKWQFVGNNFYSYFTKNPVKLI